MLKILLANVFIRVSQAPWLPARHSLMVSFKSTQFTLVDGVGWRKVPFPAPFSNKSAYNNREKTKLSRGNKGLKN
jgi:hypothetical protein